MFYLDATPSIRTCDCACRQLQTKKKYVFVGGDVFEDNTLRKRNVFEDYNSDPKART